MFSTRKIISKKPEHYNKSFHKLSLSTDTVDTTPILMLEEKRGIYSFYDLSEQEQKSLNTAFDLYKDSFQKSEKILIQFLIDRYNKSSKDADEIRALVKNNSYYRRELEEHIELSEDEPKAKRRKKESYDPSKRKALTKGPREADEISDLFALDEQLKMNDPSQLYDPSQSQDPSEKESKQVDEGQDDARCLTRSHATFFKPEQESKSSSNEDDQGLMPLSSRKVGGRFTWDSLLNQYVFATVHPPLVSPNVSQEPCETTLPQKRKRP